MSPSYISVTFENTDSGKNAGMQSTSAVKINKIFFFKYFLVLHKRNTTQVLLLTLQFLSVERNFFLKSDSFPGRTVNYVSQPKL